MATLADHVYDGLLDMIIQEEFRTGDRLPSEMVLCERFGVSRNTLRAALNKLQILGFTETKQGGGTYVRELGPESYLNFIMPAMLTHNANLLEIMELRRGIEVEAARMAAENAAPEDVEEMKIHLERCRASLYDMPQFEVTNNDFHSCISKASGSVIFIRMMDIIHKMISPVMKKYLQNQGADIDSTFYHEMILRSIMEHKPDEAAYFMDRHMSALVGRVRDYITTNKTK